EAPRRHQLLRARGAQVDLGPELLLQPEALEDLACAHQQVARLAVLRVGRGVGERDERGLELPGVEKRLALAEGLLPRGACRRGQDALLGQAPALERPGV